MDAASRAAPHASCREIPAHERRELIAARGAPAERNDLFGRLSEAKHPDTGEPMSADLLRDSLLTFMMVGMRPPPKR